MDQIDIENFFNISYKASSHSLIMRPQLSNFCNSIKIGEQKKVKIVHIHLVLRCLNGC